MGMKVSLKVNGKPKPVTIKTVPTLIKNAIEDSVLNLAGMAIAETGEMQRKRSLYIAAIFFQRVVSRTPIDENYRGTSNDMYDRTHIKDDDVVRDWWTASYGGKTISAKQLKDSLGIDFEKFNDSSEIKAIYEYFYSAFAGGKRKKQFMRTPVRINNGHERYELLEFGRYEFNGKKGESFKKQGDNHVHGLVNGYSMQAPYGMMRLTQAEMEQISREAGTLIRGDTSVFIRRYAGATNRRAKQPSQAEMRKLRSLIFNKTNLTDADIAQVMEIYE